MKKKRMIVILTSVFLSIFFIISSEGVQISAIKKIFSSNLLTQDCLSLNQKKIDTKSIIWENFAPTTSSKGLASQLDIEYPFNSQVADDFILANDSQVTGLHWWGVWLSKCTNDGKLWPNPCDFNIIFYADDGTGNMPTGAGMDDPTSTALAVYFIPEVDGTQSGPQYNWYEYNVSLPEPFIVTANTKYWIAIQIILPIPPQWGWSTNGDYLEKLHVAMQGFPLLGCPYWTDTGWGDMAFQLFGNLNNNISPPVIHGQTEGIVYNEYNFWTNPITDPFGDSLYIRWDWNDGNITDWLGPYSSGSIASASHAWDDAGVYDIQAQLKGPGGESNWSEPHTITIVQNQPPTTPIINGPSKGKRGISYNYEIESLDPENENISYYIDWADGTNTGWIGPFPSDQEQTLNHTWNKKGTYTIKAKARDIHNQESDWGTLTVTMPYEPPQFPFIQWLLERFPNAFSILRFLLEFNH